MVTEVEHDFELSDIYVVPSDHESMTDLTHLNDILLQSQVTAFENLEFSDEISQYIYALTGILNN